MLQFKLKNFLLSRKAQRAKEAFFLFEAIIAVTIFASVVVGILSVVNFSAKTFFQSSLQFEAICTVSDFYHKNLQGSTVSGETIYLDGVAFTKVPIATDVGTKYVFFKK